MKILALEEDTTAINDGEWWASHSDRANGRRSSVSVIHDLGWERRFDTHGDVRRHDGRGNVVFADGHAEFFARRKCQAGTYYNPLSGYDGEY